MDDLVQTDSFMNGPLLLSLSLSLCHVASRMPIVLVPVRERGKRKVSVTVTALLIVLCALQTAEMKRSNIRPRKLFEIRTCLCRDRKVRWEWERK